MAMRLSAAILQTLQYSDYFGFPLTLSELHSRMISYPVGIRELALSLPKMIKSSQIQQTGNYYHLPGRSSLVARRLRRKRQSQPMLDSASIHSVLLSRLPGILGLFLTGSLAMHNSRTGSDIDLLVVTSPGRLWTTRLILTLYTSAFRLRRTPGSTQFSGKLCLNLYLTPDSFALPIARRSLYSAYELVQAVPLYDPYDNRSLLLSQNSWLGDYLPNYPIPSASRAFYPRPSPFFRLIEKSAYFLQVFYMRRHITREIITPDSAFFHPHDPGTKILSKLGI